MYDSRVLVEGLLALALEEDFVCVAIRRLEAHRGGDVEVVHEACHVEKYGVTVLYAGVSSDEGVDGLCIPL